MGQMKNHEGYYDPTASRAVRNAARKERRKRARTSRPLTYRLSETRAFRKYAEHQTIMQ